MFDNIRDLVQVLSPQRHSRVTEVGDSCDRFVKILFRKVRRKEKKRSANGGYKVDLIGQTDTWIVTQDLDRLLQAACQVKSVPCREVMAECIEIYDAVLD